MASKFILVFKDGGIHSKAVPKPQAPRRLLRHWLSNCRHVAKTWQHRRFLFRFGGEWHLMDVNRVTPLKTFPADAQAAAEMYLIWWEGRDAQS